MFSTDMQAVLQDYIYIYVDLCRICLWCLLTSSSSLRATSLATGNRFFFHGLVEHDGLASSEKTHPV